MSFLVIWAPAVEVLEGLRFSVYRYGGVDYKPQKASRDKKPCSYANWHKMCWFPPIQNAQLLEIFKESDRFCWVLMLLIQPKGSSCLEVISLFAYRDISTPTFHLPRHLETPALPGHQRLPYSGAIATKSACAFPTIQPRWRNQWDTGVILDGVDGCAQEGWPSNYLQWSSFRETNDIILRTHPRIWIPSSAMV